MSEQQKQWGVLYVDMSSGQSVTESGIRFDFAPGCSLLDLLKAAVKHTPVNRVYLCGDLPAGYLEWLTAPEMYKYWRTQKIGHMLDGNNQDDYVARYEHRVSGKKLDIRSIERWIGDHAVSIFEARSAMLLLTQYVRGLFPLFSHLSGTPASTFEVLWQQYNALEKKTFSPLPENIRAALHETGQGRIEYLEDNCNRAIPGLYYYDGIFMYAALTWDLPTEIETHDTKDSYAGKQLARYRIRFTVPHHWPHIGPFGVREGERWIYPGLYYRGQTFESWVDGAELDALLQVYSVYFTGKSVFMDWDITILERIVYKSGKDSAASRPLDGVINKLVKLREKIEEDGKQDAKHARAYQLARAGMRNIVLHGIGGFNRQAGTRTYIGMAQEMPPAGFIDRNELDDGRIIYILPESTEATRFSHPEWPACVWGRCRARMFKHAMAVPYESLITIRTDAIAVTQRMAAWENGKKTGELRRKWAVEKRLNAPRTAQDFDTLQRKVTEK